MPKDISYKVEESVSVEYGITVQLPNGSYLKLKSGRSSSLRPKESSASAYDRCWQEVIKQVSDMSKKTLDRFDE